MKIIRKLQCCLPVKTSLLLENQQVRRLPNFSSPTVARLPRQVEPAGLCPDLLADDFVKDFDGIGTGPSVFSTDVDAQAFLNEYLGRFFGLEGGFFDECDKYNSVYKLCLRDSVLKLEGAVRLDQLFQDLEVSKLTAQDIGQEIQNSLMEIQRDYYYVSSEYVENHQRMNALATRMEAQIGVQNSAWVGEVNQRFHQSIKVELAAQLRQDQQAELLSEWDRMVFSESEGLPNGGFRLVPLSSQQPTKGYILSSGGGSGGFGSGGKGFGGDGGNDFNESGVLILLLLAFLYLGCLVVIVIVFQKVYELVSRRCLNVCRRLRQSLQRWHRKKRRRKILKWLLRIYAFFLLSVPLLMAIPAGEAFFLNMMEALGIPSAFRFLRWFCRVFRYLAFLIIFIKATGMGLGFLHYFYATMRPVIGEVSKYIAAFGQASPQVFLSSLLHWIFLVQCGIFLDFCFVRKKYALVVILLGLSLVCVFSMPLFFQKMARLSLSRIPELKLLTGSQLGRAVSFTAASFYLSRFKAGHFTAIFSAVFLYYFRIYQMVFLGSIPLFPNSLK